MSEISHQVTETGTGEGRRRVSYNKLLGCLAGVVVLGFLLRKFLWEVVQSVMLNVVPILFTPIVLELTVAFAGLFVVLLFCRMRRKEEESEWVVYSQEELDAVPDSPSTFSAINLSKSTEPTAEDKNKLSGALFEELGKWLSADDLDSVEIELGYFTDQELRIPEVVMLRLRLLLQQQNWSEAEGLVDEGKASKERLALACVEAARVFVKRKPRDNDSAKRCLEMGKALSVGTVVNAIDSDGRLQKLA